MKSLTKNGIKLSHLKNILRFKRGLRLRLRGIAIKSAFKISKYRVLRYWDLKPLSTIKLPLNLKSESLF